MFDQFYAIAINKWNGFLTEDYFKQHFRPKN